MEYTGYREIKLDDYGLAKFYSNELSLPELNENEFIVIRDKDGKILDKKIYTKGEFQELKWDPVRSPRPGGGRIKPRNPEQEMAFHLLQDKTIPVKILTGTYGSGKTLTLVLHALDAVAKGEFKTLVWVRNNFGVAGTHEVGHLSGSLEEKLWPWVGPLMDHVGGEEELRKMIGRGSISVVHLGFLRGRSLDNCVVVCSEAQNLTTAHVKLLLGRIGENSQLWLEGDIDGQQDHKDFERSPGVRSTIESLKDNRLFGYVHLKKTERSAVAELAGIITEYK